MRPHVADSRIEHVFLLKGLPANHRNTGRRRFGVGGAEREGRPPAVQAAGTSRYDVLPKSFSEKNIKDFAAMGYTVVGGIRFRLESSDIPEVLERPDTGRRW